MQTFQHEGAPGGSDGLHLDCEAGRLQATFLPQGCNHFNFWGDSFDYFLKAMPGVRLPT